MLMQNGKRVFHCREYFFGSRCVSASFSLRFYAPPLVGHAPLEFNCNPLSLLEKFFLFAHKKRRQLRVQDEARTEPNHPWENYCRTSAMSDRPRGVADPQREGTG